MKRMFLLKIDKQNKFAQKPFFGPTPTRSEDSPLFSYAE